MSITGTTGIEQLMAVANSYHEPEARDETGTQGPNWLPAHDHLDTPETAVEYFRRSGIRQSGRPDPQQLETLREIRNAARLLITSRRAYERAVTRLLSGVSYRLDAFGRLTPVRRDWDGLIDGLLVALVEMHDQADRIKRCENEQCRWLFLDHSKNRSRHWCESSSCGNRQRVRRFRRRLVAA